MNAFEDFIKEYNELKDYKEKDEQYRLTQALNTIKDNLIEMMSNISDNSPNNFARNFGEYNVKQIESEIKSIDDTNKFYAFLLKSLLFATARSNNLKRENSKLKLELDHIPWLFKKLFKPSNEDFCLNYEISKYS